MDFNEINKKIQIFLKDFRNKSYSLSDKDYKLSLSDAIFCADDIVRNKAFFKSIKEAILDLHQSKKDLKVIDAWSGTWVLWVFALLLWADFCLFIEHNPYSLDLSKKLVKSFWLESKSNFILWDATNINLKENCDLLISETISIDFEKEDFLKIISNLKKYLDKDSVIIPESVELDIKKENDYFKSITFNSKDDLRDFSIITDLEKWFSYNISWKVNLYKNIILRSWDCMSFFNERIIEK